MTTPDDIRQWIIKTHRYKHLCQDYRGDLIKTTSNLSNQIWDFLNITLDNESLPKAADTVDNATLLQVDITAIVGVFIFLTIAQLVPSAGRPWWGLTAVLVIPFALSALAILAEDIWSTEYVMRVVAYNFRLPEAFALLGFGLIFIMFFYIFRKITKNIKKQWLLMPELHRHLNASNKSSWLVASLSAPTKSS